MSLSDLVRGNLATAGAALRLIILSIAVLSIPLTTAQALLFAAIARQEKTE